MRKKDCAMIGVLLSLVLILGSIGFACSAEPASSPPQSSLPFMAHDEEIPATFTTYTDNKTLFSISYPADWELALSYIPDVEKEKEEIINSLKTGQPIERPITIFIVYGEGCPSCLSANISVEPILEQMPEGVSALDQMVEIDMKVLEMAVQDYRELSRVKTTINGRKATIVDCEGTVQGLGKKYYLIMFTLAGKTAWRVACSSYAEDLATWEKDFNAIVRSLRISN